MDENQSLQSQTVNLLGWLYNKMMLLVKQYELLMTI